MTIEQRIDRLIKAGWGVVESDFDPISFQNWRLKAFECLGAMFGPDHVYTKYFEQFVQQGDRTNVLASAVSWLQPTDEGHRIKVNQATHFVLKLAEIG